MKNRIWNQTKGLVATAILFTWAVCGKWGQTAEIKASNVDSEELQITQTAKWTEEAYKAELCMEIHGLRWYMQNKNQVQEIPDTSYPQEESKDEIIGGVTEEPVEPARASWEEEWESFERNTQELTEEIYWQESYEEVPIQEVWCESEAPEEEWVDLNKNADIGAGAESGPQEFCEAGYAGRGTFEEGYEEAPEGSTGNDGVQLFAENYISEYFYPVKETLPENSWIEEVNTKNQKDEDIVIYKVVYPIHLSDTMEDSLCLTMEAVLREEYRYPAEKMSYPLSQDEPLRKDCEGTGAHLLETRGMEGIILAQTPSTVLETEEARVDLGVKLQGNEAEIKAGGTCIYELHVMNTGDVELRDIQIKSMFEKEGKEVEGLKAVWDENPGIAVQGSEAQIPLLKKGEAVNLFMEVQFREEDEGRFLHKVLVKAPCPKLEGEIIGREALAEVKLLPLKADFTVEKTADRSQAYPGDTVNYQICIRNTGERTLHSVLSTERFLGAGVQAQFQPKEGVTLNETKTQALIEKIAPGEAFALLASVTLPQHLQSGELINQVTVVSRETGARNYQSQASVRVVPVTVTPSLNTYSGYQTEYSYGSLGKSAYAATTQPKTGDETETGILLLLLGLASVSVAGVFWKLKEKSKD